MKTIKIGKKLFYFPSNWDEMTPEQLEILANEALKQPTPVELKVRIAIAFLGMRIVKEDKQKAFIVAYGVNRFRLSSFLVNFICNTLDFIFAGNEIYSKLTKNPYPSLRMGFLNSRWLCGPGDALTNITVSEFVQAEVERIAYEKTKKAEHLYRWIAILWRPTCQRHPDGDMRAPLLTDTIDRRAKRIARLNPNKLRVILWWYYGSLTFITRKFPDVFSSDEPATGSPFDGFLNLINELAKNDLTKIDKVRDSLLFDALYNLQKRMDDKPAKASNHDHV